MTQPTEAVGGEPSADSRSDAIQAFEDIAAEMLTPEEEEQPQEPVEGDEPEAELDETDLEEEADDLPPIEPPVSWDAEAKAKFAELPRDVQEYLGKRESERERFVQSKSQEATRAKQDAIQTATAELAQIERSYAEQYETVASQLSPQRPNPLLLQQDPATFYAQQYAYENALAQQRELQQQAGQLREQAKAREAQAEQAYMAEQHRIIVENFPEYADPTSSPKLQAELSAVARELGYSPELISQARAEDILAMRKAAEWKAKADRLDGLNSKKMEKVRAAKGLPKVAKPGVPQGGEQLRANRAQSAFERAKSTNNAQERGAAFYEYLQNTGQI